MQILIYQVISLLLNLIILILLIIYYLFMVDSFLTFFTYGLADGWEKIIAIECYQSELFIKNRFNFTIILLA